MRGLENKSYEELQLFFYIISCDGRLRGLENKSYAEPGTLYHHISMILIVLVLEWLCGAGLQANLTHFLLLVQSLLVRLVLQTPH